MNTLIVHRGHTHPVLLTYHCGERPGQRWKAVVVSEKVVDGITHMTTHDEYGAGLASEPSIAVERLAVYVEAIVNSKLDVAPLLPSEDTPREGFDADGYRTNPPKVVDLMAALEASLEAAKAKKAGAQ
jgi:hypothetical protein